MKKLLFAAVAVFAFGTANAQGMKFGAKAGLNMADWYGDDAEGADSRTSFHVGGFAEFKVSDKFAVQPELLYSSQGAKGEGAKINTDYINLPVMAKFYATDKLSIEAGPQIGFLMSAKLKPESGGGSQDVKDQLKSTDFGVNFGLGYNFTDNISGNLRYNLGLSEVPDSADVSDVKNGVFSLSLGYSF
ncbi:PorT family protein [Flavobacterium amniphilum]|uniref:porin family protein n=1 Tax=Flavobacterium amniphilum TaxID=1834035 RepID=UPI00202A9914|nr:porin family protein [Flavobacterium amniphilum]MCL9806142.1 PorT family protein [Flavobacterium amniphilum]